METMHRGRIALTAGLWLAIIYTICVGALLLLGLPPDAGMYRFWELWMVGVDPSRHWTLALGLLDALLYGAAAGWSFAAIYNFLAPREGTPAQGSA